MNVRGLLEGILNEEHQGYMSVINLGELYYMQCRKAGMVRAERALRFVQRAGITVEPASNDRVMKAARLKAEVSLSYADAFAATLAEELQGSLVTGDPEYKPLASRLRILWL